MGPLGPSVVESRSACDRRRAAYAPDAECLARARAKARDGYSGLGLVLVLVLDLGSVLKVRVRSGLEVRVGVPMKYAEIACGDCLTEIA